MRFLALHRGDLEPTPYARLLGPAARVRVLTDTAPTAATAAEYAQVRVLDTLESGELERHALEMFAEEPYEQIVALSEYEIVRAARLREHLGLRGQRLDSALAFRDKLVMKELLEAGGVPVAPFTAVDHCLDLLRHLDRHGLPFVLKPRWGAGSVGVEVIDDEAGLDALLAGRGGEGAQPGSERLFSTDLGAGLLAESFVEGELLHIDGVVRDGELRLLWPFTHGETSTLDYRVGGSLISHMLDRDDPRWEPVTQAVHTALRVLPTPEHTIVHAEAFWTPDGEVVLNEIACRMGGAKVHRAVRAAFGVSMTEELLLGLTGRPGVLDRDGELQPERFAGWSLIPPQEGTVTGIPETCPLPGVEEYQPRVRPGERVHAASASVDALASLVVTADSADLVAARLRDADAWVRARIEREEVAR